jgi:hypothetical protein
MKMTIKFNKDFYNLEAVKKASIAYEKLADFEIKEKKGLIEAQIKNINESFKDTLLDEFSNYVLSEMKNAY